MSDLCMCCNRKLMPFPFLLSLHKWREVQESQGRDKGGHEAGGLSEGPEFRPLRQRLGFELYQVKHWGTPISPGRNSHCILQALG